MSGATSVQPIQEFAGRVAAILGGDQSSPYLVKSRVPWIDPRDYGATGDNATDDTNALQAALNAVPSTGGVVMIPPAPGGAYRITRGLRHKSNTTIIGCGPAGWIRVAANFVSDPTSNNEWLVFRNVNGHGTETSFSGYRDRNIVFDNVWVDMRLAGNQGAIHAFDHRAAECVKILNCYSWGGGNCTAAITCNDHLVQGCTAIDSFNCCYDHWGGSKNCRVVNSYGTVASGSVSQIVNFNGIAGPPGETWEADGFLLANCDLFGNASQRSINVEQLGTGGSTVKNVRIIGNRIHNGRVVVGGGTSGVLIQGNHFIGSTAQNPTIYCRTQNGVLPTLVSVIGNHFRNCNAPAGFGLIDTTGTNLQVIGNIAEGGTYEIGVRYGGSNNFGLGNSFPNASAFESLGDYNAGGDVNVQNGRSLGMRDTSGGIVRWVVQQDNNLVLYGTNASGNQRPIFSNFQRNDASSGFFSVPVTLVESLTETPVRIAAAGATIGAAATTDANWVEITSSATNSADGFRLTSIIGRRQSVTNSSGGPIKVYPRDTGAARINGAAIGASVTVPDGATWQFIQFSADNYRVVAKG